MVQREVLGKVSDYLAAGCRVVWLVNPSREAVSVFRSPFAPHVLTGQDLLDCEDFLPGREITLENDDRCGGASAD